MKDDLRKTLQDVREAQTYDDLYDIERMHKIVVNDMNVPAYVLRDSEELKIINTVLKPFAEKGILVHVNTGMYDTMKQKIGLQQLRRLLKNITPHNDKLGFDWDKSKPGEFAYKADATSKHYNKSTYV